MAVQNLLIMNLLRLITPEEIADIATKHNGGKFLSLTDLVNERVEHKIHRDFSSTDSLDIIHDSFAKKNEENLDLTSEAKILPFKLINSSENINTEEFIAEDVKTLSESRAKRVAKAITTSQIAESFFEAHSPEVQPAKVEHLEDENMSSFILVEKNRLKKSQKSLKQKEIIDLYQKNSNVDVEQIKSTNQTPGDAAEAGVLVNKKQY
jgi:hypothetical protein